MLDYHFLLPKTNDFQWRNLYLKEYGLCTYAPPMPKHPEATAPNALDTQHGHRRFVENNVDSSIEKADESSGFVPSNLCENNEEFNNNNNYGADASRQGTSFGRDDLQSEAADDFPVTLEHEYLEALNDEQLFSSDLFGFLSHCDGENFSLPVLRSPRTSLSRGQSNYSHFGNASTRLTNGTGIDRATRDDGSHMRNTSKSRNNELLRLQRETWHLLMDNRIMTWFEREAQKRNRTAASVKQRLLEVISLVPEIHSKVAFDLSHAKKSIQTGHGEEERKTSCFSPSRFEFSSHEDDEKLMHTLDQFSPFFCGNFTTKSDSAINGRRYCSKTAAKTTTWPF